MPCHVEIHLANIGEQVWVGTFFTPIVGPPEGTSLGATLYPQAAARPDILEIENKTFPPTSPPPILKAESLGAKPACLPAAEFFARNAEQLAKNAAARLGSIPDSVTSLGSVEILPPCRPDGVRAVHAQRHVRPRLFRVVPRALLEIAAR